MIKSVFKRAACAASVCSSLVLFGCASQPTEVHYPVENPAYRSILVAPIVNRTTQVNADKLMQSVINEPFAERGYYPFPPETVRMIFEHEGLYEPERAQEMNPKDMAQLFGSDMTMLMAVDEFDTKWLGLTSRTVVKVTYKIFNKVGDLLQEHSTYTWYDSNQVDGSLSGLLAGMVVAAIARGVNDVRPAAHIVANGVVRGNFAPGQVWGSKDKAAGIDASKPTEVQTDNVKADDIAPVEQK